MHVRVNNNNNYNDKIVIKNLLISRKMKFVIIKFY